MTFDLPAERDKFIESNFGLVKDRVLALNKGIFDDDLFQVGTLALIQTIDRFDKSKGSIFITEKGDAFTTYTVKYIDGYIRDYKNYDSLIKPLVKKGGKFQYKAIASLDEPMGDFDLRLEDTVCECGSLEESIISKFFVDMFMSTLSDREQKVIELRLKGMTQKNISQVTHINQPQVSIIVRRVRKKYLDCIANTM